jgi:hypothetical protein
MPIGQSVLPVASYDDDLGVYADVMIGQQDASGGPMVMDPPKPTDETPGKRRVPKPINADRNTPTDAQARDNTPVNEDALKYVPRDFRSPGKAWSIRHVNTHNY